MHLFLDEWRNRNLRISVKIKIQRPVAMPSPQTKDGGVVIPNKVWKNGV